jgi:hypothetical protein
MISSLRLIDAIRSLSIGHDKPITASLCAERIWAVEQPAMEIRSVSLAPYKP